jgi:hypothetical protein
MEVTMNEHLMNVPQRLIKILSNLNDYNRNECFMFCLRCKEPTLQTLTDRIQYYLNNILKIMEV